MVIEQLFAPDSDLSPLSRHLLSPHRRFVHFRSWRCPLPSDQPTGVLSTFVAATVRSPWNQPRNRSACSDVADNANCLDFSYEIADPTTCRLNRSSVHG